MRFIQMVSGLRPLSAGVLGLRIGCVWGFEREGDVLSALGVQVFGVGCGCIACK